LSKTSNGTSPTNNLTPVREVRSARVRRQDAKEPVPVKGGLGLLRALGENLRPVEALVRRYRTVMDGWENSVTGSGTSRDRSTYGAFVPSAPLQDVELSNLYHFDDMAGRMVDILPQEMLREPFQVNLGDRSTNQLVSDKFEALGVRSKFREGMTWGRLFGGCATLIGADDLRSAEEPLIAERAKDIAFLYTIDRRFLQPYSWYVDIGHPKLGQVEKYMLTLEGRTLSTRLIIHESRLIMWGGALTGDREKRANNSWDYSVLQRAVDVIRQFNSAFQSVDTLLTEANQNVFKIQNLNAEVGANGSDAVSARMALLDLYRSLNRALLLDAGNSGEGLAAEEFERVPAVFTGIPEVLDKVMLRLASTVRIPVTILMGQSPAGMNATGESDFRWFYDQIRADQRNILTPRLRQLADVWTRTQAGPSLTIEAFDVEYDPLWTETPAEEAERKSKIATTDKLYVDMKALRPEEVALNRFRPEGFTAETILDPASIKRLEKTLKQHNDNPEPKPEPPQGSSMPMLAGSPTPPVFPQPAGAPEQDEPESRQDASDLSTVVPYVDMTESLRAHPRSVIVGGPRSGKTSHASRAGERYQREVLWEDQTFRGKTRDQQAAGVASDINRSGEWIMEGCATVLGIRQWLADNPEREFPAAILYLRSPIQDRTEQHVRMAKGVHTVWEQVLPELRKRGATIIERETGRE
jgi:hypothetical protein